MIRALLLAAALFAAAAADGGSLFPGADPDSEMIGDELWIFPTGRSDTLAAWASADGRTWQRRGVLLRQRDIRWIRDDAAPRHYLWAPDMVPANGRWYLYYSVGPQHPTPSRLGVAVCDTPAGPCVDSGKPLLTGGRDGARGEFEAIDPMVFTDIDGTRILYVGGSAGAQLRAYVLAPDLLGVAREVAVPTPPGFTEGAFVHRRDRTYYLSYSAGNWQTASYSVHHATGPTALGPWTYRGAILVSDQRFKGPGHHSFVRDPRTGAERIVYHRWERQLGNGPYRGERRVAMAPIAYAADGGVLPVAMAP